MTQNNQRVCSLVSSKEYLRKKTMGIFSYLWHLCKNNFFILLPIFKSNLPPEDKDMVHSRSFKIIGFAVAIWERAKPEPYFKGSKMGMFKGKE